MVTSDGRKAFRPCTTCGQMIFFKKNSEGKMVPFNAADHDTCHYVTCTHPPNVGIGVRPGKPVSNGTASFKASNGCHELTEY